MLEIEMKFPVSQFGPVREHLQRTGARADAVLEEADHYYNAPDRDFAKTDEALRLRRIGPTNLVTYKGPKETGPTKTRTEIELALEPGAESADKFCRLLSRLGYRAVAVVRKKRICYHFERSGFALQACLDEVDRVGCFVEAEIVAPEEQKALAQDVLLEVTAEMGLRNPERRSYLEMFLLAAPQQQSQ
jgi:adenylate cyclase class 2